MVTLNEIAILIYDVLNDDAALRASNRLNGTGRIFNHPLRPAVKNNPTLTIEVRSDGYGETGTANFFMRLLLYLDTFNEITADVGRAGLIQDRIFELLDRKQFVSADNVACRQCVRVYESGPLRDAEASREALWIFAYNLRGVEKT